MIMIGKLIIVAIIGMLADAVGIICVVAYLAKENRNEKSNK